MNSDWESKEETTSLHIPINAEAKKEYDEWVKAGCDHLWWYWKERRKEDELL